MRVRLIGTELTTSDHVPPRFHPDVVYHSSANASDAASLRLGLPVLAPLLPLDLDGPTEGRRRRERERGRDGWRVCVCVCVTGTEAASNGETDYWQRDTERERRPSERERNGATDTH